MIKFTASQNNMEVIRKHNILENVIYGGVWLIIYLSPVLLEYYEFPVHEEDVTMNWQNVWKDWVGISFFFSVFLINNFLLSPYLFFRKKYISYTFSVVSLIVLLLAVYPFSSRGPRNGIIEKEFRKPERMEPRAIPFDRGTAADSSRLSENHPSSGKFKFEERLSPPGYQERGPDKKNLGGTFRFPFPVMVFFTRSLVAFLMVGFNVAIQLFFKTLRNEELMKELERHNLQSELEYLKYQINPHFFMNTLNNIHALVDIDTERAKSTIVELSKMMRYVLYEANNKTILLSKEVQFLDNYVRLMKIRYPDKVDIQLQLPVELPEVNIPPLLFISFIENAFKHGVTYQSESFIKVSLKIDRDSIIFRSSNSNHGKNGDQHKGIGLENIRKRLKLLFRQDYVLSIEEKKESFDVLLIIPIQ